MCEADLSLKEDTFSTVLEEEIDPNYVPTDLEIVEYAKWLGIDVEKEAELLWIAKEGLMSVLPADWKPCKTNGSEEIYYFNFVTGESSWDHPCDGHYRQISLRECKKTHEGVVA